MSSIYWRKFGIELEFSSEFNDVKKIVYPIIKKKYGNKRLYCRNKVFRSHDKRQWHLKNDHSTQAELVTPISSYADLSYIKRVIEEIERSHLEITKRDGTHFTLQAHENKEDNIILSWLQIEDIILKCFPKYRRDNYFCKKINRNNKECLLESIFEKSKKLSKSHNSDISLENYNYRKTIEFRLSEGTKNPDVVENWLKFYMLFLNYAENINFNKVLENGSTKDIKNIQDVISLLNIKSEKICNFLKKRFLGDYE